MTPAFTASQSRNLRQYACTHHAAGNICYGPQIGTMMRCVAIIGIGVALLLAMEVGFSLAIDRYEISRAPGKGAATHFFKGPISALLGSLHAGVSRNAP
jgi:hypothetical protein